MISQMEEKFIDHLIATRQVVTVFLVNGVKLQGFTTFQDDECMLMTRDGLTQLIYKKAISTIMPSEPIQLIDLDVNSNGNR